MRSLKDKILHEVSEKDIFLHFMKLMGYPHYKIKQTVRSPLRRDQNPSFGIYQGNNKKFYFKDFAGDQGDCWHFAELYYEIYCGKKLEFKEMLVSVAAEMGVTPTYKNFESMKQAPVIVLPEVRRIFENMKETVMSIEPVYNGITPTDTQKAYLKQYGIEDAASLNIHFDSVRVTVREDSGRVIKIEEFLNTPDNPVFTFYAESFLDGSKAFRVYQPLVAKGEGKKHYGNVKSHHIYYPEKYPELIKRQKRYPPLGDVVVLTGGYKDAYLLNEYTPLSAASTGGEGWALHPSFVTWMKQARLRPIIYYDKDQAGMDAALKLCDQHDIAWITNDNFGRSEKDVSDLVQSVVRGSSKPQIETYIYQTFLPTIQSKIERWNYSNWFAS